MKLTGFFVAALCLSNFSRAGHLEGVPPSEQQRAPAPAVLKQVAPDLYFFYNDASSNSAFLGALRRRPVCSRISRPA